MGWLIPPLYYLTKQIGKQMTVIFQTKSKNQHKYIITNLDGFGRVYFEKGFKSTTDKDLIKALLSSPLYKRGDYYLATNEELVDKYLGGELVDYLTEEILSSMTLQGIKDIGKALGIQTDKPNLIKIQAIGEPLTTEIQEIVDYYTSGLNVTEKDIEEIKASTPAPEPKAITSKDLSVRKAMNYINETSVEDLQNFLSEDEDRKTIIEYLNKKLEE